MKSESVHLTEEEEEILLTCEQIKRRLFGYSKEAAVATATLEATYRNQLITYHHTAPGFQLLERILIFFRADVQWLYVVTALVIVGFTFAAIWTQSTRPALAALFFVITGNFFLSLNIVSQYMAVAISTFACTFAEKKKPVWFFLLVALAASFHVSALVFLPVYFLPRLKVKPLWCVAAVAAALLADRFAFPLVLNLVRTLAPTYAHHLSMESAEFEWIFFGIGVAVLALGTWYWPKAKDLPFFRLWYYMNVIGLVVLAFSAHVPLVKRINYYFAAPHFLLIPMLLSLEKRIFWRRALHAATVGLFCAMIAVAIGKMNRHATLPYQAFFQGDRVEMMKPYVDSLHGMWDENGRI